MGQIHRNGGRIADMERRYQQIATVRGINAMLLVDALNDGRPVEFEIEMNGNVRIKAVTAVKPQCRREFIDVLTTNMA